MTMSASEGKIDDQILEEQYAVFEREPQKGPTPNGIVMGPYFSKEEAEQAKIKWGFISDNFYVDEWVFNGKQV